MFVLEDVLGITAVSRFFTDSGYYCEHPHGSSEWKSFWVEERRRCLEGYGFGGLKITGDNYFYLNYTRILLVVFDEDGNHVGEDEGFPDFRDADYEYYWHREIQRYGRDVVCRRHGLGSIEELGLRVREKEECYEGGYNMCVGKARQTGWSYKITGIAGNNYYHRRNSRTVFMGYDDTYVDLLFAKFRVLKSFVDMHTPWNHRNDHKNSWSGKHIRASKKIYNSNGSVTEGGYKSEVVGLTFGGSFRNAARGLKFYDGFIDEAGAFGLPGNLIEVCGILDNSLRSGKYKTGMLTILGTSGDMAKSSYDLATIHANPMALKFLSVYDAWNYNNSHSLEGLFFPRHWGWLGFYDKAGNSDLAGAMAYELEQREKLKANGAKSSVLRARMQEDPLNSKEAFGIVGENMFPTVELSDRLLEVNKGALDKKLGNAVRMRREGGSVSVSLLPNFDNCITGLYDYSDAVTGEVIIYEMPNPMLPRNYYKIGYDPVKFASGTDISLASIVVFKPQSVDVYDGDKVVAEFIGRRAELDDIDEIFGMLCDLYNSEGMYENEVPAPLAYFKKIGRLDILASQPDDLINTVVKRSRVKRVYGCHVTDRLKDSGLRYINTWLRREWGYDENQNPIYNYSRIQSKRLLEELCAFNPSSNKFDMVSALIMVMIQLENSEIGQAREERNSYDEDTVKKSYETMMQLYANN